MLLCKPRRFAASLEELENRTVLSGVSLVADLNTMTSPVVSGNTPSIRTEVGQDQYVFYSSLDESQQWGLLTGAELWHFPRADDPVLIETFPGSNAPDGLVASGDDLYFILEDHSGGIETLWRYSLSQAVGTPLIEVPTELPEATPVSAIGDALLLSSTRVDMGTELWRFTLDATPDPSDFEMLANTAIGGVRSQMRSFTTVDNEVFFESQKQDGTERLLWKTDGTVVGTSELTEGGERFDRPAIAGTFNGELVVTAHRDESQFAVSLSDDGQFAAIDIDGQIVAADGSRLFSIRDERELWMTDVDGQETLVWRSEVQFETDHCCGRQPPVTPSTAQPSSWVFHFWSPGSDRESIITNGSVVVRMTTDPNEQQPDVFRIHGTVTEEILFEYEEYDHGGSRAWWSSDGSVAGTSEYFQRYEQATTRSDPDVHGVAGGKLYFTIASDQALRHLHTTDGTASGTQPLAVGWARNVQQIGETVFFGLLKNSEISLWYTDGTPEGTRMVPDISDPRMLTPFADAVVFVANGSELWSVDRNGLNPVRLSDAFTDVWALSAAGDRLFISGTQNDIENGLWVASGIVTDEPDLELVDTFAERPLRLGAIGARLFFTVQNEGRSEVWTTDGTATELLLSDDQARTVSPLGWTSSGTFIARPGMFLDGAYVLSLASLPGQDSRVSIWLTDGTDAGTRRLDLDGTYAGHLGHPSGTIVNEQQTNIAVQTTAGIWISDGTAAGSWLAETGGTLAGAGETDFYVTQSFPATGFSPQNAANRNFETDSLVRIDVESKEHETLVEPGAMDIELGFRESVVELNGNAIFPGSDRRYGEELRRIDLDPIPGDANGDNVVDVNDFLALSRSFGKARDAVFAEGDFDEDGDVDVADFLVLSRNFRAGDGG